MTPALWYLVARSATNAVGRMLRSMRRPARLLGLLAGVAYLAWLSRQAAAPVRPQPGHATLLGALGLLVLAATTWIVGAGGARPGEHATRSLLWPAPIPGRDLVLLLLVSGQVMVLPNVALWALLSSRGASPGVVLQRTLALWVMFTTIMCHRALVARVRGSSTRHRGLRRAGASAGVLLLASIPFALTGSFDLAAGGLQQLATRGIGAVLLLPFELPVRPLTATSTEGWLQALPAALLLLGIHVALLLRLGPSREPVHDPGGGVGRALPMPMHGAVPLLAWRSITAITRRAHVLGLLAAGTIAAAGLRLLHAWGQGTAAEFAGFVALTWAPLALLLGPQFLRAGLRRDADRIALLRSLPEPGERWLLGGALGGGLITALLAALLLFVGLAGAGASAELGVPNLVRPAGAGAALVVMLPVAMLATLVQDGLFLFFQAGAVSAGAPQAGPTRLGTTLINSVLSASTLLLLLAAPLGSGLALAAALPGPLPARILLGALGAAALTLGLARLGARWLGMRFDRMGT